MGLFGEVFKDREKSRSEQTELGQLFEEFYDRLVYFSYQLVRDRDTAKDITQDVFIKYWQQRGNVDPSLPAIRSFLYTSVKNASLNHLRHTRIAEDYAEKAGSHEPVETSVMEAMITAEVLASIHAAVQSLPEAYRVVSVKGYFEGKKNQEIADELGISVNTVKKQKQRALELLRLKLTPEVLASLFLLFGGR